jgi:Zn-dependent metalloprotease
MKNKAMMILCLTIVLCSFVIGQAKKYVGDPEKVAREFLLDDSAWTGFQNLNDLRVKEVKTSLSGTHVVFEQQYKGISVLGNEVVIHIDNENFVIGNSNKYKKITNLDIVPNVDSSLALNRLLATKGISNADIFSKTPSSLSIYYDKNSNEHKLVWKFNRKNSSTLASG